VQPFGIYHVVDLEITKAWKSDVIKYLVTLNMQEGQRVTDG
jgi:hypothetical protein